MMRLSESPLDPPANICIKKKKEPVSLHNFIQHLMQYLNMLGWYLKPKLFLSRSLALDFLESSSSISEHSIMCVLELFIRSNRKREN